MPLAVQAKLLRVLQDGVVRRVGSERTDSVVDIRFISAMNRAASIASVDGTTLYRLIEKHNVGVRREAAVTEPQSPAVESR
jgi:transcriptional regulator with GAF, ATPase, and Fis domain